MKIDLSGVSETLLVTLYMRAKDAKSNHPFLNDLKAAEIISCMDYDFSAFDSDSRFDFNVLAGCVAGAGEDSRQGPPD